MRRVTRAATVAVAATGLLASTAVVAAPAFADSPKETVLKVRLANTPSVGGFCDVRVSLHAGSSQIGNAKVKVQWRLKGNTGWRTLKNITTRSAHSIKVTRKSSKPVQVRAYFGGTEAYGSDWSNLVTCTPKALKAGAKGSSVKAVQQKLKKLRIRPASTSGKYDYNTTQAVFAFQKAKGLKRTGTVTGSTYDKLMATTKITPPSWCKSSTTICVDISQQAAYLKVKGLRYTIPISSGGNYYYYDPQSKRRDFARTPTGNYRVYYKKPGLSNGPLGTYYWMSFFTGGYGVHGSASVPAGPASHGCIRVPRPIEKWVYKSLPVGATVHVHK